jgi:hypothetical protein
MKTLNILFLIFILGIALNNANSQDDSKEKFKKLLKTKIAQKLEISDTLADKYLELLIKHRQELKQINKDKKATMNEIEEDPDAPNISEKIELLLSYNDKISLLNKTFLNNIKEFLTPKQIALSIIFQKNLIKFFQKQNSKFKNK